MDGLRRSPGWPRGYRERRALSAKEEATVKAQAFLLSANDYLVKLPDKAASARALA